jgi:hypothetical protein
LPSSAVDPLVERPDGATTVIVMKLLRHLSHQPLLIWTLVLVVLVTLTTVGLSDSGTTDRPGVAAPRAQTGWTDAQQLLEMLPGANAALASGTFASWLSDFRAVAVVAAADHTTDGKVELWEDVVDTSKDISTIDFEDRALMLGGLERLNTAVLALVRAYR